ncbi:hypothetical protein L209DRAFT_312100 [Thermothelomyces heterothallicus CBS 203.75]
MYYSSFWKTAGACEFGRVSHAPSLPVTPHFQEQAGRMGTRTMRWIKRAASTQMRRKGPVHKAQKGLGPTPSLMHGHNAQAVESSVNCGSFINAGHASVREKKRQRAPTRPLAAVSLPGTATLSSKPWDSLLEAWAYTIGRKEQGGRKQR